MEKWEYLVVDTELGKPQRVNGQELQTRQQYSLPAYMDQLGSDGWELVGTVSYGGESRYSATLYFKRRKP